MAVNDAGRARETHSAAEETDPAPAAAARLPWSLTAAEWRQLIITFVGSLTAIVAGAAVIGGAIGLDRLLSPNRHQIHWTGLVITSVALLLVQGGMLLVAYRMPPPTPVLNRFVSAFAALVTASLLLIWIGLAAGVH